MTMLFHYNKTLTVKNIITITYSAKFNYTLSALQHILVPGVTTNTMPNQLHNIRVISLIVSFNTSNTYLTNHRIDRQIIGLVIVCGIYVLPCMNQ